MNVVTNWYLWKGYDIIIELGSNNNTLAAVTPWSKSLLITPWLHKRHPTLLSNVYWCWCILISWLLV